MRGVGPTTSACRSVSAAGDQFYRAVEAELGTKRNWVDSADLAMMFRGPYTTGFYRRLHTVLHREFRNCGGVLASCGRPCAGRGAYAGGALAHAATALRHAAALPVERARLERLARVPHEATAVSAQTLTPDQASRPSAQPD